MSAKSYTAREIATLLARNERKGERASLFRQIQHWTEAGLFGLVGAEAEALKVGKGRSRRYPRRAISWAAIMAEMAEQYFPIKEMKAPLYFLRDTFPDLPNMVPAAGYKRNPDSIKPAPNVFIIFGDSLPITTPEISKSFSIAPDLSGVPESQASGVFINVSAVLRRIPPH